MPPLTGPAHGKNALGGPAFHTHARAVDGEHDCCKIVIHPKSIFDFLIDRSRAKRWRFGSTKGL
jgi:hypothetical protein